MGWSWRHDGCDDVVGKPEALARRMSCLRRYRWMSPGTGTKSSSEEACGAGKVAVCWYN